MQQLAATRDLVDEGEDGAALAPVDGAREVVLRKVCGFL
jgi:hypothetical protein